MAGVSPAIGPVVFRALRASAYDLPEDFVRRLEPGLDPTTVASLEVGLRAVDRLRALWRWTIATALIGLLAVFLGAAMLTWVPLPWLSGGVAVGGLAALALSVCAFLSILIIAALHRADIHRLEAFARAMRGSSLARDIS